MVLGNSRGGVPGRTAETAGAPGIPGRELLSQHSRAADAVRHPVVAIAFHVTADGISPGARSVLHASTFDDLSAGP